MNVALFCKAWSVMSRPGKGNFYAKFLGVFLLFSMMQIGSVLAQTVTLSFKNVTAKTVFNAITHQTGFSIIYKESDLQKLGKITIDVKNVSVEKALKECISDPAYHFQMGNKTAALIYTAPAIATNTATENVSNISPPQNNQTGTRTIKGRIVDDKGLGVESAAVEIKGTKRGVLTDAAGNFTITVPSATTTLTVTHINFQKKEIELSDNIQFYSIKMEPATADVSKEVVVTGIFNRKKESFTGSVSTFTGTQLKEIGSQNVIQSLKTLDPSFVVLDNNLQGSNPNALPVIELRGKTSLTTNNVADAFGNDPNQPLFILDGFETSLQSIIDLDMNRVASITILKDAASTAIYGSKAANGVVVVETIKPAPGKVNIIYAGNLIADIPDLNSYNLMDATQKLEFERLSGVYNKLQNGNSYNPATQLLADDLYNKKLSDIQKGVNTYWLSEPVHVGFTNAHSLSVSAGSNELLVRAGLNYKALNGVMKGSGRNTWGGNMDVTYRKGKINLTNRINISGFKADDSPYGSFENFALANPYYKKYNEYGGVDPFLEKTSDIPGVTRDVANPLYNALLFSINQTKNTSFSDNLVARWTISNKISVDAGLQVSQNSQETIVFKSPDHTDFANTNIFERGSYRNVAQRSSGYVGNLSFTYANVFAQKHSVTANFRTEIQENKTNSKSYTAIGFPSGSNGNPIFAAGYPENGKPTYSSGIFRRNNLLVAVNYAYDQRYLVDVSYRLDGSTVFGQSQHYTPFASLGVGWNIYKESFLRDYKWINLLKLRASIGNSANQNSSGTTPTSIYTYAPGGTIFGPGMYLTSLGNPDLKWQKTLQKNIGLDLAVFNNRITAKIDVYQKYSDPLVVQLPTVTSTGVSIFTTNAGALDTRGVEGVISVSPVYNLKDRIIWTLTARGSHVTNKYANFGKSAQSLNKLLDSSSLMKFRDGYSMNDIWAVRSLGIDPATGREMIVKANGEVTFVDKITDLQLDDQVRVGNTSPEWEGTFGTSFTYKEFTFSANFRFRWGGDLFNTALYNKVENISWSSVMNNQDERAFTGRWQKPGDVAKFKAISTTSQTGMTSRFVQKDNQFIGESITASYRFSKRTWIRHLSMEELRLGATVNNIFRISSVDAERGIAYPFSNTASFTLSASF